MQPNTGDQAEILEAKKEENVKQWMWIFKWITRWNWMKVKRKKDNIISCLKAMDIVKLCKCFQRWYKEEFGTIEGGQTLEGWREFLSLDRHLWSSVTLLYCDNEKKRRKQWWWWQRQWPWKWYWVVEECETIWEQWWCLHWGNLSKLILKQWAENSGVKNVNNNKEKGCNKWNEDKKPKRWSSSS